MAGVEARTGPINRITASDVLMGDQLAQTTITMHGKARDVDARISLVRESGLWRVDALPEIE
jgi:hypothetical protein